MCLNTRQITFYYYSVFWLRQSASVIDRQEWNTADTKDPTLVISFTVSISESRSLLHTKQLDEMVGHCQFASFGETLLTNMAAACTVAVSMLLEPLSASAKVDKAVLRSSSATRQASTTN